MKTNPLFTHLNEILRDKDKEFLKLLYQVRCLCIISGAFRFFFSKIHPYMPYCEDRLHILFENRLIDIIDYPPEKQEVIFLTQLGVDYLETCVEMDKNPIFGSLKSARQLRVNGRMIGHQLAVNATVLELLETADRMGTKYQYYDKLFTPAGFEKMPSNGMIILDGRLVLVEIDTGSIRGASQDRRWGAYRKFLDNLPLLYKDYSVTILIVFSQDNDDDYDDYDDSGSDTRRYSIAKSVCRSGLISNLNGKVDLYTVDRSRACDLLENDFALEKTNRKMMEETVPLLRQNAQFKFYIADSLKQVGDFFFLCYMCRNDNDGNLVIEDRRAVEFLIDFWDGRLSVLNRIRNINMFENTVCNSQIGREIPYVVVVPDMRTALRIMTAAGVSKLGKVYFTTPARIKKSRSFYGSLFRIDEEYCVWGFRGNSLKHAIFERELLPNTRRKS